MLFSPCYPGQELWTGSGRKTWEIAGTWTQYSDRNFFLIFPGHFTAVSRGKAHENGRKSPEKSEDFPAGILLLCSMVCQRVPAFILQETGKIGR
jgi:hypothetical protein